METRASLSAWESLNSLPPRPGTKLLCILVGCIMAFAALVAMLAGREHSACAPVTIGHSLVVGSTCR